MCCSISALVRCVQHYPPSSGDTALLCVCGEVWGDWMLSPIGKSFERRLNLSGS